MPQIKFPGLTPAFDLSNLQTVKDTVQPFRRPLEDHYQLFEKIPQLRTTLPPSTPDRPSRDFDEHINNIVDNILSKQSHQNTITSHDMRHNPSGNMGTHAMVAVLTSTAVFLNWYLVLEKVNNPDAGTLIVLFSTIPVEAVLLNLLSKFTTELWQIPVMEKVVRPKIAALFNKLKLTAVTPAFRSANGLPSYFNEKMNLTLRTLMFEHELIDLKDDLRKLEEIEDKHGLDQEGVQKKSILVEKVQENSEYLKMLKKKLDPLSHNEVEEPIMFRHFIENTPRPLNPHAYTMMASIVGTASLMLYLFGLPDPSAMQNTRNLLIFFLTKAFIVYPIRPLIEQIMVIPVYEYLARPQIVQSKNSANIEGVFPSLDGILGLPPRDRWLYNFDLFIKSIESVKEKYALELFLLTQKDSTSSREEKRKQDLEDILPSINEQLDEINNALKDIRA